MAWGAAPAASALASSKTNAAYTQRCTCGRPSAATQRRSRARFLATRQPRKLARKKRIGGKFLMQRRQKAPCLRRIPLAKRGDCKQYARERPQVFAFGRSQPQFVDARLPVAFVTGYLVQPAQRRGHAADDVLGDAGRKISVKVGR